MSISTRRVLTIRGAKLGKIVWCRSIRPPCRAGRLPSPTRAVVRHRRSPYVFVSTRGNRLDIGHVHRTFYALSRQTGLAAAAGQSRATAARLPASLRRPDADCIGMSRARTPLAGCRCCRPISAMLHVADTYWYLSAWPELMAQAMSRPGAALGRGVMNGAASASPTLLERFFTQRLMQQRRASAHTIASYRDTFRLLLQFAQERLRKAPSALALEDVDAPLVLAFLDDLEQRARRHGPNAQPAADRDPLVLPLRAVRGADACGADPARAGHSGQALRARAGAIS